MNTKALLALGFSGCLLLSAASAEVAFQPVAVSGSSAPGFGGNAVFSQFSCLALADDGRVVFTAQASGTGITIANRQGIWAGLPGSLNLIARGGNTAPGAGSGVTFKFFNGVNIDNHQHLAFVSDLQGPGIDPNYPGSLWVAATELSQVLEPLHLVVPDSNCVAGAFLVAKSYSSGCNGEALIHDIDVLACGVDLYGTSIGSSNNEAILVGSYTDCTLSPRSGTPAPGTSGNFLGISTETKALTPDGKVAFSSFAEGISGAGLWFGAPGALQAVALPNRPAPASLLGADYTFSFISDLVEVNARGELAFTTFLNGPGLNNTNSAFVVAGPPNALRVVAQSGQPAPGISGAFFQSSSSGIFNNAFIGSDGSVAFVGSYTDTGNDYGLWLASSNGSPRLIARSGAQAPGTPAGVVFTNSFQFLPPFEELYMNARNQIAFRANLGGPGVGSTNSVGIWLAEPDGTVNLIARAGDTISAGGSRKLAVVTLGQVGVPVVAGPEDGRPSPLNDRGELLFAAYLENPSGQGLFIARTGIVLSGARAGNDIRISFPTISGKNYRADYSASLSLLSWFPLAASVPGTGGEVIVTDTNAPLAEARFYRVVRLD